MRTKTLLTTGFLALPLLALSVVSSVQGALSVSSYGASVPNSEVYASGIGLSSQQNSEDLDHAVAPPPRNRTGFPPGMQKSSSRPIAKRFYRPEVTGVPVVPTLIPAVAVTPKPRLAASATLLAVVDQQEIEDRHKRMANDVILHVLPERCRDTLKNFYVKYEKQKSRGLAGKDVMILDGTVPDSEFRALFIHESGHNMDLGCLQGTPSSGVTGFTDGNENIYEDDPSVGYYQISWITSHVQRSDAKPEDFPSGYASYDAFEDFAEGFVYFVLQNDAFLERAKTNTAMAKKYTWFKDVLFEGSIPQVSKGKSEWAGKAPWDITKLPYTWNLKESLAQR